MEGGCRRAGLGATTVLEEMARGQSTDVVLPTQDGRPVRLGRVVHPAAAQTILLDRLGLELPKRLRLLRGMASE